MKKKYTFEGIRWYNDINKKSLITVGGATTLVVFKYAL